MNRNDRKTQQKAVPEVVTEDQRDEGRTKRSEVTGIS